MALLKQSTTYTRMFLLVQSADHVSGLTGATPTVTLSKAGGTFAAAGGTVTEVANGLYKIALTTTDTNTLGDLAFHITATSGDPRDFTDQVIAVDLGTIIENQVWDAARASHVATGTVGQSVQLVTDGTAQAGASGTLTLAAGSSSTTDFYKGNVFYIYAGTGAGQPPNICSGYNGTTKVATMQNTWTVTPDATSKYIGIPSPFIADIWDEARSAHNTAGTFGEGAASVQGNVTGSVGSVSGSVGSVSGNVGGNVNGNVAGSVGSVTGAVGSVTAGVTVTTNNDKTGYSLTTSPGILKNTALANFPFVMTDATTHAPKTGLTVTATRSLDGAAFAACANSVVEVASGVYKINLAAADLNGTTVVLLFTATGADALPITIKTQA